MVFVDGFLNVLKPPGMTSHDVVARVRRLSRAKTGHTGTLDPAAAGVLVLALGKGTRLASYVTDSRKAYRAELKLGVATNTGDAAGEPTASKPVPPLDAGDIGRLFRQFTGVLKQQPPMHSAVHHQGTRLYHLARQGLEVERPDREITLYSLDLVELGPGTIRFDVSCSKGTYIRVLCEDLARALGTVGHMAFLVRLASGPFALAAAWTLEEVEAGGRDALPGKLLPLDYPLETLPSLDLPAAAAERLVHGHAVPLDEDREGAPPAGPVRVYSRGRFIALGSTAREQGQLLLKPGKVLV
jgi:tRNA pseudouridine55 synthase